MACHGGYYPASSGAPPQCCPRFSCVPPRLVGAVIKEIKETEEEDEEEKEGKEESRKIADKRLSCRKEVEHLFVPVFVDIFLCMSHPEGAEGRTDHT